jgi:hypothetical protein
LNVQRRTEFDRFAGTDDRDRGVFLQRAGKDSHEAELLDERVDAGLEHLGDKRSSGIDLQVDFFTGRILSLSHQGIRRQSADGQLIQQFFYANAGLARAAEDRNQRSLGNGPVDEIRDFFIGRWRAFKIAFGHSFINFDDRFEERFADVGRIDQRAGGVGWRFQRVDDAAEIGALAQRHIEQHTALAENLLDVVDQLGEVDVVGIHPVDDDNASQAGFFGFQKDAAGVDFDARLSVDDDCRGVDASHGADGLTDEIGIAWGVDHREVLAGVIKMDDRRFDGVFVVLLFFVEVANAGSVVNAG